MPPRSRRSSAFKAELSRLLSLNASLAGPNAASLHHFHPGTTVRLMFDKGCSKFVGNRLHQDSNPAHRPQWFDTGWFDTGADPPHSRRSF